jgi:hypothetical protein
MSTQRKVKCLFLLIFLVGVSCLMGCVFGVTRVNVSHDPLNRIENKKQGNILVNEFKDVRESAREYIGSKRNLYGMRLGRIGTESGVSLTEILTKYFAESLNEAGYKTVVMKEAKMPDGSEKIKFDAMLEGEIVAFWLDLYMGVWQIVDVKLTAKHPDSKEVLWEKVIHGDQTNVLWLGATGEYEKVIRQALTQALNKAASEFASDEFFKTIRRRK